MPTGITVAIPVGPEAHHIAYLAECLESVVAEQPDQVLLIDDMQGLTWQKLDDMLSEEAILWLLTHGRIWESPWRLGVAHAFNFGVALASNDRVFMLGADDKLLPGCLEACTKMWEMCHHQDAYYWVGVQYSDGRPDQYLPCNAAMVTKGFWASTGGFPPETAVGAPDAGLVSILWGNKGAGKLLAVSESKPLYWYRVHNQSDTAGRGPWQGAILQARDLLTANWQRPAWGRSVKNIGEAARC